MDTRSRLAHLVPHWIEHNDSHVEQLEEWAEKAREAGLGAVADEIEAAAGAMKQAEEHLGNARAELSRGNGEESSS